MESFRRSSLFRPVLTCLPAIAFLVGAGCGGTASSTPEPVGCPEPGCPAGTVSNVVRADDRTVSGTWTSPAGSAAVTFSVVEKDDGASAVFSGSGGVALSVDLVDAETVSFHFNGTAVDGNGIPDSSESAVLDAIAADRDLVAALSAVPLELGCGSLALSEPELAALLAPWQLLLKYRTPGRIQIARAIAQGSSCAYFDDPSVTSALPVPVGVMLSFEHPIPAVLGHYPFDDDGALDADIPGTETSGAAVTAEGPCGSKCRGACGADCNRNNCSQTIDGECVRNEGLKTGEFRIITKEDCGVHQGCVDHDDCYDACNVNYSCGKDWGMFGCLRSCDAAAVRAWGVSDTQSWARGYGPFQYRNTFELSTVKVDNETCPPDEPVKPGQLPGRIYIGTTPSGEPGDLGMGLYIIWPNDDQYDMVSMRPIDGVAVSPGNRYVAAGVLQLEDMPSYLGLWDCSDTAKLTALDGVANLTPGETGNDQLTGPTFVTDDLIVVSDSGMLRMWDGSAKKGSKKIWDGWNSSAVPGSNALVVETSSGFKGILDVNQSAYSDYDPWNLDPTVIQFQNEDPSKLWTLKGSEAGWIKPKVSPDGERIAFLVSGDRTAVHDARITTGGDVTDHLTYAGPGGKIGAAAWSPDGKWIAFVVIALRSEGGGIWVVERGLPSATPRRIYDADMKNIWFIDLAWGL